MSEIKVAQSSEVSLKRGRSNQSESEETAETHTTKRRRHSQSQEIEACLSAKTGQDAAERVLSDTNETARNDLVTIADGLQVTGDIVRNNVTVRAAVEHGLKESACNNELIENSTEATATTSSAESVPAVDPEVAQPASSNTNSLNDSQTIEPVRKAKFRYDKLYRLLRASENAKEEGIRAQEPNSNFTIHKHVSEGSSFGTQYISTSASWDSMVAFARNKKAYTKRIATIDVAKLEDYGGVKFFDLTDERMRQRHLKDQEAKNRARKYDEVLITGVIPASCIIDMNVLYMKDSDSDEDSYDESDDDTDDDSDDDFDNVWGRRRKKKRNFYDD